MDMFSKLALALLLWGLAMLVIGSPISLDADTERLRRTARFFAWTGLAFMASGTVVWVIL